MRIALLACALVLAGCPKPEHEDRTDCKQLEVVDDPPDGGAVTWDSWTNSFVNAYCVGCHNPKTTLCGGDGCHTQGDPGILFFDDRAVVTSKLETIRCGVATTQDPAWDCGRFHDSFHHEIGPRTFPKCNNGATNLFPSDRQRAIMVDWVNAGAP